ncbi:hypothetical protein P3T73_08325 [Kiritimatiellota bacterium B12222]|nr:hypothetical protein P3T73_08325 [Kiritimatiellota bacterium B12222]
MSSPQHTITEIHNRRLYLLIGLFLLVFTGTILCLLRLQKANKTNTYLAFHADAFTPRPWALATWTSLTTPDPNTDPFDLRFDPQITLLNNHVKDGTSPTTKTSSWFEVNLLQKNPQPEVYDGDTEIVYMEKGRAPFLDGEIEILYTGQTLIGPETLDPPYQTEENYWPSAKLQLFDITGTKIRKQNLQDILSPSVLNYIEQTAVNWGKTYGFSFGMRYPAGQDILITKPRLYDPDSLIRLNNGYGSRSEVSFMQTATQVPLLSGESILATLDIFHGPIDSVRIEHPHQGSEVLGKHFRAQVLFLMQGGAESMSMGHPNAAGNLTLRINTDPSRREAHLTSLGITTTPNKALDRIIIEAVHTDGELTEFKHRSSSHGIYVLEAKIKPEHIRELRFQYREGAKRVITEIPLWAMPEDAKQVENLFDQVIPLTRIRSEMEWQSQIADFTQLDIVFSGMNMLPEEQFPLSFENLTVRELLEAYLLAYPDVEVSIDESAMKIDFQQPTIRPSLWNRVKFRLRPLNPFRWF